MENVVVFFCPPLSEYPKQPTDMSKCEIIQCPICEQKMWLSEKKKIVLDICKKIGKPIILECYTCFLKRAEEDPEKWGDSTKFNI